MCNLPKRFKIVREEKGFTQKQVADAAKIGQRQYQDYEYGNHTPSAVIFIAIAKAMKVSLDYLVGQSDDP
ncbi:MAG: helix-turn-helix domain-containing protein [Oscillospiraceae bacterium]|nr:helix-turn-helix domain-containing protein [Oscillospiraceae bacterium]